MLVKNLQWLWKISAPVCEHETGGLKHKANKISILKRRLVFATKAAPLMNSLLGFKHPRADSPLQHAMQQRPEIVGAAMWPYICSSWSAKMALHQIEDHFKAIETMGRMFDFPVNRALLLLELGDLSPDLQVALDQPKWFMREGLFVINLFVSDIRIYSLAFSFAFESGRIAAYIGAVQGVDTAGILDDYKNLTKALQGMRPRDFLVEVFRIFCRCAGIARILAVNDSRRQHRSSYFGADKSRGLFVDYNDIWIERGGLPYNEDFFVLALETPMKNLEDVPSKKRAMYRRRYELLQLIEERMQDVLKNNTADNIIPAP
ncbi:MAG: DUF535 family protein [Gallionellaceae bacterium]|nr:DUF535 family protein [Gallionellaceae bacterium]